MISKCFFKTISPSDLKNLEKELKQPLFVCNYHYVLTDNYIIKCTNRLALIKYKDILLIYKKKKLSGPTLGKIDRMNEYLILITHDSKYKFLISSTVPNLISHYADFSNIIKLRNFEVLDGYNEYNIQKIKEKYGIKL